MPFLVHNVLTGQRLCARSFAWPFVLSVSLGSVSMFTGVQPFLWSSIDSCAVAVAYPCSHVEVGQERTLSRGRSPHPVRYSSPCTKRNARKKSMTHSFVRLLPWTDIDPPEYESVCKVLSDLLRKENDRIRGDGTATVRSPEPVYAATTTSKATVRPPILCAETTPRALSTRLFVRGLLAQP